MLARLRWEFLVLASSVKEVSDLLLKCLLWDFLCASSGSYVEILSALFGIVYLQKIIVEHLLM